MTLIYDRLSRMFTLDTGDEVIFLGPFAHSLTRLQKEYELSMNQAREAVLRAIFNAGYPVDLDNVKHMAKLIG